MLKYHIVTLGCQMNRSDSERVRTVIEGMGYRWTDTEQDAGLLGVLACSVRQKSIDKVYSKISKWNEWKNNRNLLTFISGCVLPADKEKFLNLFDIIFPVSDLELLPDLISQYGIVTPLSPQVLNRPPRGQHHRQFTGISLSVEKGSETRPLLVKPPEHIKGFWKIQPSYNSDFEAFVPIQNGCDKFCTFCAVPYTRGREISRPSMEILDEVKQLVDRGYKSITLLGQNVNSYGKDKHGEEISFAQLLSRVGDYGKAAGLEFWIYFTSPHPRDMSDEVLEVIAAYPSLAKQIHLPLQSGDDKVLIRMNRKHSVEDYASIIESIRSRLPDATIFTDIIVGFTGETEEQFENTRLAMERFRFNMAYIAVYSPRPGAASSRWDDDIPAGVKKKRLHILTDELIKYSSEYNKGLIGKDLRVLVTGADRKEGHLSGHTEGRIVTRFASGDEQLIGQFVNLRITGAASYAIEGERIE